MFTTNRFGDFMTVPSAAVTFLWVSLQNASTRSRLKILVIPAPIST